jgi:DNA polymerase III delta prime subunit
MKYYETHYEDYLKAVKNFNLHPELVPYFAKFPANIHNLTNLIFYGPSGVGKTSQMLYAIQKYSPSSLNCDKKICIQTEKNSYQYHISDIHYEIDMSLLGCNSKLIWHEIVQQIVDIVSVKPDKIGILVCKNFHLIHSELLEIFYSYIQEYNTNLSVIQLRFIIVSEHISYIPNNILDACEIIHVKRPEKHLYVEMVKQQPKIRKYNKETTTVEDEFVHKISNCRIKPENEDKTCNLIESTDMKTVLNIKELNYFGKAEYAEKIPDDIFNIICDAIIAQMLAPDKLVHTTFRDSLYDILTYNLDTVECIWYIFSYFVENDLLKGQDISHVLTRMYNFLKYFNNNYRPIYHLESIMHYIIIKTFHYDEFPKGL